MTASTDASLDAVLAIVANRFPRREPRTHMIEYVQGLLATTRRKNGWTLAEQAGLASPDAIQRLLRTAVWDVDGVRDDVRDYALGHLRARDGIWIVDETGFAKRGTRSAGVARQYLRGTKRIENCQVGLFLAYVSSRGKALVDRELYLPPIWLDDADRRLAAGIPARRTSTSKPQLALGMLARAYGAGLVTGWVTADKTYGAYRSFRTWLLDRLLPYVVATNNDDTLILPGGSRRKADDIVARLLAGSPHPASGWVRRGIPAGPYRGQRFRWATVDLTQDRMPDGWRHSLLVRQQLAPDPGTHHLKVACYRCVGPADKSISELVRIAGSRWMSEDCFQAAKTWCGLDQYQVRDWRAWYAHITLAMLALAHVVVANGPAAANALRHIPQR